MQRSPLLRSLLTLAACVWALLGCSSREPPMLLGVTAVTPHSLEPGDAVEVSGVGFPIGKTATVTFEGRLARAGAPVTDFNATLPAESSSGNRLSFVIDPDVGDAFCGKGDARAHATFRGRVVVAFAPRIAGAPPIAGALSDVTLEVFPPHSVEPESGQAETTRLLTFLGVELEATATGPDVSALSGLRVSRVNPHGIAEQAGLRLDDVIVRANGVTALEPSDLIPAVQQRNLELLVERGDARSPTELSLPITGFARVLPESFSWAAALVLSVVFVIACFAVWPRRAWSYLELCLARSNKARQEQGSQMAPGSKSSSRAARPSGLSLAFLMLGVAGCFSFATRHSFRLGEASGLWLSLALMMAVRLLFCFVTSGLDPRYGFKFFRAAGFAFQFFLVELGSLGALIPLTLSSSSLRLQTAVNSGSIQPPWQWPAFRSPFGLLLLLVFLTPVLLDITSSQARSGLRVSARLQPSTVVVLLDWVTVLFKCEIAVGCFLGGASPSWPSSLLGVGGFVGVSVYQLKYALLVLLVVRLRTLLGSPRAEEFALPYLRWLSVPLFGLAVVSLVPLTAERFALLRWLCATSGYGMCLAILIGGGIAVTLGRRVFSNTASSSINPWL